MVKSVNLNVHQGTSFTHVIQTGMDLTGATLSGQFRKSYFNQTYTEITLAIQGDPTLGDILMSIDPSATIGVRPGLYLYDVIADVAGDTTKVQEGILFLMPTVTQPA